MPITELRIEGLRTIERLRLPLDGLTVLIGENGSGKSSIIEACELLRRAASGRFIDEFYGVHGGLAALLKQGATRLSIGVVVRPTLEERPNYVDKHMLQEVDTIEYVLGLTPNNSFAMPEETLSIKPAPDATKPTSNGKSASKKSRTNLAQTSKPITWIERKGRKVQFAASSIGHLKIDENQLLLEKVGVHAPYGDLELLATQYVASLLRDIRVHLPFEVTPAWAARALDRKSALRSPALFAPAPHLEKLGLNLANAFHALKNSSRPKEWQKTLDYIRLGLGERVEDVVTWPDPGGGNIGLSLKYKDLDRPIPTAQLSDGTLAYLAFVALFRQNATRPSLLAMDEPDLHLHPHLLMRVLDFFEAMAKEFPVLLATHSDRLLDGLSDPARSVVLCELDENQATRLVRPDREALARWLERYRGLGDIRSAGHAASVLTKVEPAG